MTRIKNPLIRELVLFIARALVQRPDDVRVEEFEDGRSRILELRVAQSDLGRIIGREGQTARAIRTVVEVATSQDDQKAKLEIAE